MLSASQSPLNILSDPAFSDLRPALRERLARLGDSLHAEQFSALLDPLMTQVLHEGFALAGADEGTVWLVDQQGEHLVPGFNTGPRAGELVGKFVQPLKEGLICMVFATEEPFLENEVWKNARQSKTLDGLLQLQTHAMIAVPFGFLQACRGVISCVQFRRAAADARGEPPGFRPEHLARVERTSALLSRLLELRLLSQTVGWS